MYAAFRLVRASPTAGARIIIRAANCRAGFASNRAITLEPQGMRWQVMAGHVGLDVEGGKSGKWFHLQAIIRNAHKIQISPDCTMKTLAARNHHIKIRKRFFQGNSLADVTAGINAAPVQQAIRILSFQIKRIGLHRANVGKLQFF